MIRKLLFKLWLVRKANHWRRTHYYQAFLHHWAMFNRPGAWARYQQMQQRPHDE